MVYFLFGVDAFGPDTVTFQSLVDGAIISKYSSGFLLFLVVTVLSTSESFRLREENTKK